MRRCRLSYLSVECTDTERTGALYGAGSIQKNRSADQYIPYGGGYFEETGGRRL